MHVRWALNMQKMHLGCKRIFGTFRAQGTNLVLVAANVILHHWLS